MAQSSAVGTFQESKLPVSVDDIDLARGTSPVPASQEHAGTDKDLTGKGVGETSTNWMVEPLMHQTRYDDVSNIKSDDIKAEILSPGNLNEILDDIINIDIGPSTSRAKSLSQMSESELKQMASDNRRSLGTVREGAAAIANTDSDNDEERLGPLNTVKSHQDDAINDPQRTNAMRNANPATPHSDKENATVGNNAKSDRPHRKHKKQQPEHKMPAFLVPPPHMIRGLLANDFLERIRIWSPYFWQFPKEISLKTLSDGQSVLIPHTDNAQDALKHPVKYGNSDSFCLIMIKAKQFKINNIPSQFKPVHFTQDRRVNTCCNLMPNSKDSWTAILYSYEPIRSIVANGKSFKAFDYKPGPKRCTKCQKFGHQKYQCKSKTVICAFCAEKHDSSVCFEQIQAGKPVIRKCANCYGTHTASDHKCPKFLHQCGFAV